MKTIADFTKAQQALQNIIRSTSLIYSEAFSAQTGNHIYLKPENMQVTGSYKIRGAFYKVFSMTDEQKKRGIITSSAGNHAQGVAYAAQANNIKATIVMPTTTPLMKINATKKYGATVVLAGDFYDEAYTHAIKLAEENGLEFVHPFNDSLVATGQGTIAFELFADLPDADIIIVPIGGGGLAAGISTLAKLINPTITVIGVEPKGAACMCHSLKQGDVCSLSQVNTIADGVAVQTPGDLIFPYIQKNIDDIYLVDDREIPDTFIDVMEHHKMIVENAGLLSVAVLKQLNVKNKKIISVLSGGNMDIITMSTLVQHGLINRGRICTFAAQLPDKPGELVKVATIIAQEKGNVIRLDHNQFVNINRKTAVELTVTLETDGHEHKNHIFKKLEEAGYTPTWCTPTCSFEE